MGESAGTAKFFQTSDELSVANSLVQYGSLSAAGTEQGGSATVVNVLGLDDFVGQRGLHVDFLKIDVEGAELQVLRGAPNTFAMRPFVSLGLHPEPIATSGGSLQQIWDLLMKYRMAVTADGKPISEQDFCGRTDRFDVQLSPL
jgi:hypothetical protein